jgi:hypothetical protein
MPAPVYAGGTAFALAGRATKGDIYLDYVNRRASAAGCGGVGQPIT